MGEYFFSFLNHSWENITEADDSALNTGAGEDNGGDLELVLHEEDDHPALLQLQLYTHGFGARKFCSNLENIFFWFFQKVGI